VGKIEDIKYLFDFSRYHPEKDGAETMWFSLKLVVAKLMESNRNRIIFYARCHERDGILSSVTVKMFGGRGRGAKSQDL
jgi:hypothetical protein